MLLKNDLREMTNRWHGSYIGIKQKGKIEPFMVSEFFPSKSVDVPNMTGNFLGKGVETIPADNLVFEKPSLGLLNYKLGVVFVSNLPIRQYRRGLVTKTLKLVNPFGDELKTIRQAVSPRSLESKDLIAEMFNPSYPSVRECIDNVRSLKRIASAFNNKYAIGIKKGFKSPRVFYKGYNIGRLDDKDVVHLRSSSIHLLEELSQYLQCVPVRSKQ